MHIVLLGLLTAAFCLPQVNTGAIPGSVTDPSGGVIAGARVTALNDLTGFSRVGVTDADGSLLIPLLPVSDSIRSPSRRAGSSRRCAAALPLQVGQNLRADFPLQLGNVTERVEVGAATTLVDTHS